MYVTVVQDALKGWQVVHSGTTHHYTTASKPVAAWVDGRR